ncbi:MAG: hypothetical protein ABIE23_03290 [archaeon]|nr:hypothetical protein [Candidatus Micrarchaeota archaeon]
MIKDYWKEILIVIVLTVVLMMGMELIPEPELTKEMIFSPMLMLFGMIVLFLPLIPAIIGGYLITRKTIEFKEILFAPAIGLLIAGIIIVGFSSIQLLMLDDAGWEKEFDKVNELGLGLFEDMTLQEFKNISITSTLSGTIFIALFYFAIGLLGGFIGRAIALNFRKTDKKNF